MKILEFHYWQCLHLMISGTFWTLFHRIYSRLTGVKLGTGCRFQGKSVFHRLPGGRIEIGKNCIFNSSPASNLIGISAPCILTTLKSVLEIGDECGFSGTRIAAAMRVRLGNRVRCGANTVICDTDWHSDDPRAGKDAPVVIEDGVWLGGNVTVWGGVTIGKNSIIGAGSVVTADIPENVIAVGNPAKVIKKIEKD